MTSKGSARLQHRITREAVVAAAEALIGEVGIDAFSLRGVAARIGIKAPSLYNHFTDKADLLAEVAKSILLSAPVPRVERLDWREFLIEVSLASRRAILQHAQAAPLLLHHFPREVLLGAYERTIRHLGAPLEHAMVIVEGVEKLTLGSGLFAAAANAQGKLAMPAFDAARYPLLAGAIAANPFAEEELVAEALRRFLSAFPDRDSEGDQAAKAE